MYVKTSELHFCSPHWKQKYLNPKKNVSLCKTPLSYVTPMHTLPLFCPTPCMPSSYSAPTHACPPPILSRPRMPSPYSIPPHAYPPPYSIPAHAYPAPYSIPAPAYLPPILSHPMHTLPPILYHPMHTFPLFYPTPCTPSPYSIPAHAHPPLILPQPIHTLHLFYSTPYMPSPYSIPLYACPLLFSTSPLPPQYSIPAHACPPNSLSHEPGRHVSPLTPENAAFWICSHWAYHHHLPSLVIWSINLWHLNVCCFHSHEFTTLNSSTH